MPERETHAHPIWLKLLLSTTLAVAVALSWTGQLDDSAHQASADALTRALTAAALARGLNGVISVAQGTEIAIQPIGIGVTLTIGEILDPLNDLIERFSWLALLASVSLGMQLFLGDIVASVWASALLSAGVGLYLAILWSGRSPRLLTVAAQLLTIALCLRFLLALVLLATYWIDDTFLIDRQQTAMASLTHTSTTLEQMQDETQQSELQLQEEEEGFFDRTADQLGALLDTSRQSLDLKAQLAELSGMVESSVEEIINLIVIFLLQTIVIPIATLWLSAKAVSALWRRCFLPGNP